MTSNRSLFETLERVNISLGAKDISVLEHSGADIPGNERVHRATNAKIEEVLATGELGTCIHVTGGARALTDPIHRSVCTAIVGRGNEPFKVLYNVPEEKIHNSFAIVRYNLEEWDKKGFRNWRERLQTLDLVGFRGVDLKAYNARNEIQYSVFGHRFVQLQGIHTDSAAAKNVWLIESERLNEILTEHAICASNASTDIDESIFRDFYLDLHSSLSRYLLRRIHLKSGITRDGLLGDAYGDDPIGSPPDALNALQLMGFVRDNEVGGVELTPGGLEFMGGL